MDILYATNEAIGNRLVFAPREWAESVARIHQALQTATTWGEFKEALTDDEFEDVLDRNELDDDDIDLATPFDAESDAPGYADGDYPDWLQQRGLEWFPKELIAKFGEPGLSMINGEFLDLPPNRADEIAEDLRAIGHTVTRSDLYFY